MLPDLRAICGSQELLSSRNSLEAILVDLERPNLRFQRRARDPQLHGSARRPEDLSLAFSQGCFDNFLLLGCYLFSEIELALGLALRQLLRQPALVHRKIGRFAHDDGSFANVLQLASVSG